MHSFLGVPVLIRGNAWGNLYLTDKQGGDFDAADEQTAVILADWAAVAIENASLYLRLQQRRDELEQVVQGLEATTAIARAVGAETQLDRVLELIVKRGRALVDARAMVILLRDGDEMEVAACAGEAEPDVVGRRIPVEGSTSGGLLRGTRPERIRDVANRLRISSDRLGVPDAHTALLVPLEFRGRALGVLVAFDRIGAEMEFGAEQETLLQSFAASAATAVATAQTVEHERLRESMAAAEQERRRWARELHDETLQGLAGFQVLLSSALRRSDAASLERAVRTAVEQIGTEIEKLRMLITELRPAALDELGLQPAIESLASRVAAVEGLEVETEVSARRRGRATAARAGDGRLPARAGGAHERRQARAREPRRDRDRRARRARRRGGARRRRRLRPDAAARGLRHHRHARARRARRRHAHDRQQPGRGHDRRGVDCSGRAARRPRLRPLLSRRRPRSARGRARSARAPRARSAAPSAGCARGGTRPCAR